MNFRLVWTDPAIAELARFYTATLRDNGDASAIAQAAARVDQVLERDPVNAGESRAMNTRVMFELPLTVYFEVHTEEQVVVVTWVRFIAPRG